MNPQPSKPIVSSPMTAIRQPSGDRLGVRPDCEPDSHGLGDCRAHLEWMRHPSLPIQAFCSPRGTFREEEARGSDAS
jgi:hypothetical protein